VVKISTIINIEINRTIRDIELENKIPNLKPLVRLFSKIKFNGSEIPEDGLIDTGAHISVIPFYIWKKLNVDVVAEHKMSGAVPDKILPVNVGYVKGKFIDEYGNESKEIRFLSYLTFTNKVPIILGIRDLLEKFDLCILFSQNKAYIEENLDNINFAKT